MNPSGGHPRLTRFGNATHFVRLLRVRNPAALKLLARSRRKTVPGDEGSFFLTEQTFYLESAGNRTIVLRYTRGEFGQPTSAVDEEQYMFM